MLACERAQIVEYDLRRGANKLRVACEFCIRNFKRRAIGYSTIRGLGRAPAPPSAQSIDASCYRSIKPVKYLVQCLTIAAQDLIETKNDLRDFASRTHDTRVSFTSASVRTILYEPAFTYGGFCHPKEHGIESLDSDDE